MPDDIEYLDDDEFYDDDLYDNGLNLPHLSPSSHSSSRNGSKDINSNEGDEEIELSEDDNKNQDEDTPKKEDKDQHDNKNADTKEKDKNADVSNGQKNTINNNSSRENNQANSPDLSSPINNNLPSNNQAQNPVGQNLRNNKSNKNSSLKDDDLNEKLNNNKLKRVGTEKSTSKTDNVDNKKDNQTNTKAKSSKTKSESDNLLKNSANDDEDNSNEENLGISLVFGVTGNVVKKVAMSIAPFLLLLFAIIIITVILLSTVSGVENKVNDIYDKITGTEQIDEDDEDYQFISRLKDVNNNYVSKNKMANMPMVIATFVVISLDDNGIDLNNITEDQLKSVIDSMLNGNSYSEDLYKQNLPDILSSYFPSYSTERINNIIDNIFIHYRNYVSIYGEPSLAIRNVAVFDAYWWPIGSITTTTNNGKTFAKDEPATINITSPFGSRVMFGQTVYHSGIDIANGSAAGEVNIIASKAGEVIYPTETSNISFGTGSYGNRDGGGLGNYVKIRHSDGTITVYGHMYADSITVKAGETVEQGQVIGKMGTSGSSTGVHLHFSVYVGGDSSANAVDPLAYVDPNNPRQLSSGVDFSLTNTVFSEDEFVAKMQDYYNRTGNANFQKNFLSNAREIYRASADYGVNPELIVITALTESNFGGCGTTGNYWGIGIPNGAGCSAGPTYATMRDGVKGYADTLAQYNPGGSFAGEITNRYNERLAAGCKAGGYGLPGTLAGMQSVYSWAGDYRYNPGSSGLGGCYFFNLDSMYGAGYCSTVPTCTDYSNCPENSRTSVCEQSDYTLFQITQKIEIRQDIFGL